MSEGTHLNSQENDTTTSRHNDYISQGQTGDDSVLVAADDGAGRDITNENSQNIIDEEKMSTVAGGMETGHNQSKAGAETEITSIHSNITDTKDDQNVTGNGDEEEEETPKETFRPFTKESYIALEIRDEELRLRKENNDEEEGRLVDGEIVFDEDESKKMDKDPLLADGQSLPEKMGRFPKELLGVPIEEIDPNIKAKSFVAIAKKFKKLTIFRFTATKALFLLPPWNPLRRFCIQVVCNQFFDLFILLTIIINCIVMAINPEPGTQLKEVFEILEYIFQAIYTVEMFVKVISKGFLLNKYTYLRDGWNWLDFGVVILAYITITLDQLQLGDVSLSGLRAFRVLRALKSISVVPGLRTIVNALLKSLKMLGEVMLLTLFCIAVFALLALQLYMGTLRQKCIADVPSTYVHCNGTISTESDPCFLNETHFQNWWLQDDANYLENDEGDPVVCGTAAGTLPCPSGYTCQKAGPNPNFGYTHFDNFGWAMLNTFQLVTLDYWESTYNLIVDASGPWNMLFFMMVVFFGSFYLINLMLAVVAMAYEQEADAEAKLAAEEEAEEKAKAKRKENTAMLFDPKKLKQQLLQKQKEEEEQRRLAAGGQALPAINGQTVASTNELSNGKGDNKTSNGYHGGNINGGENIELTDLGEPKRGHTPSPTKTQGSEVTASGVNPEILSGNNASDTKLDRDPELGATGEEEEEDEDAFHDDLPDITQRQRRYLIQKYATLWFNKIKPGKLITKIIHENNEKLVDRNCGCCSQPGWKTYHNWVKFQNMVYKVASDGFFELFITLCIICNTIVMACESYDLCELCRHCPGYVKEVTKYGRDLASCSLCDETCVDIDITVYGNGNGMSDSLETALEISNVVFTFIFTFEAIIKLIALSKDYFKVGWNNFDLFIVIFSLPDVAIYFGNLGSVPGISELTSIVKIFRLMRIIKLAQSWSTMKTLLSIIIDTLSALGNLTAILLLVMFICSILGQQLLGESYKQNGDGLRWHFQDFFHSFLLVFRILCGEWIEPLWDCMNVGSQAVCTLLILVTLIIGNFMVLNLFLALLLNAFTTDNIKESASDEESKMVTSIKNVVRWCKSRGKPSRVVTPTSDPNLASSQLSLASKTSQRRRRIDDILDKGKPTVTVNGSTHSIKNLIQHTEPLKEVRNGSALSVKKDGVELKPIANGHTKTSRSGSIISILSNGTNISNGVLKNGKVANMSPENLKQIEDAFTVNREEYSTFQASMDASAPKPPVIVKEDASNDKKITLFSPDEMSESKSEDGGHIEEPRENEDNEEKLVNDDGTVNLSNCFCDVCHKNPAIDNCCTPLWTRHREVWAKVVSHPVFEGFILFLIAASSITLCFEDNTLHEKPTLTEALQYLNIVFAVLFFIEMVLKLFALGVKKYFTSFWTILDFIIVQVAIIDILGSYLGFADLSAFKILRVLRALRPLRAVSRWQNMKIVVNALIFALPAIGNVFIVIIVFWLIFAIFGVQIFKGKFFQCQYDDITVEASIKPAEIAWVCNSSFGLQPSFSFENYNFANYKEEINANGTWYWPADLSQCDNDLLKNLTWAGLCERLNGTYINTPITFDNVLAAYLALFQVATFEGWMEVMEASIDAPLVLGGQPFFEQREFWYFYFLAFIVFGAFFTLNLFIGVIIENFNELKKQYDGSYLAAFLTENQRHYYNTLKKLGKRKPQKTIRRPKNKFQAFFFDIAVNTKFEIAITIIIFLNMIVMMLDYLPPPETDKGTLTERGEYTLTDANKAAKAEQARITEATEYVNLVFTLIFVVEAIIKIIGLRWHYFRRAWNVFDFVVVALSVVDIASFFSSRFGDNQSLILEQLFEGDMFISPTLLRVVRVFRIGRVLRLVKSAKGIRKLLFALIISIPALFNIAILLFIFMFIFAVVGMTLFSNVRHEGMITSTVNFDTFPNSMVLLFRLSTSAGWNDILDPLKEDRVVSECNRTHYVDTLGVPQTGTNCGDKTLAPIFMVAYLMLSFMIVINMYIAVILENFAQAHEQEEIGITEDDFDMFYVIWEKFDPLATQYIKLEQLPEFLDDLEDPLGVPKPNGMAIVSFNLPIVEGDRIHCLDVLMALVRRVLHTSEEETPNMSQEHREANDKLKQQIAEKYRAAFPQRQKIKVVSTTMQRKKEDVAAKTLQRAWRKHRMKQNILRIKTLALDQSQRDSISQRLSETIGSIKSRIGSAVSRLSRRGSTRSARSIDSQTLNVPPELLNNSNQLTPQSATRPSYKTSR